MVPHSDFSYGSMDSNSSMGSSSHYQIDTISSSYSSTSSMPSYPSLYSQSQHLSIHPLPPPDDDATGSIFGVPGYADPEPSLGVYTHPSHSHQHALGLHLLPAAGYPSSYDLHHSSHAQPNNMLIPLHAAHLLPSPPESRLPYALSAQDPSEINNGQLPARAHSAAQASAANGTAYGAAAANSGRSRHEGGAPPRERARKHGCWMCEKSFDRPSTLKKHLLVHTGVKAYVCDICGRRFGVASNLNRHVKRCSLKPANAVAAAAAMANNGNTSPASVPGSISDEKSNDTETHSSIDQEGGTTAKRSRTSDGSTMSTLSSALTDTTLASSPEASSFPPTSIASTQTKRRRRAPSPSHWVPPSLRAFNLSPSEACRSTAVPLPPVRPWLGHSSGFSLPTSPLPLTPGSVSSTDSAAGFASASASASASGCVMPADAGTLLGFASSASSCSPSSTPWHTPTSASDLPWPEERDSWDDSAARLPYHPSEWRGRLPGPGLGFSGDDAGYGGYGGHGGGGSGGGVSSSGLSGLPVVAGGGLVKAQSYVVGRLVMPVT
ncbi:hypothetical protein CONPUDRAFT_160988 [Coniophora puteana RWD-64-598 SS2]|uniref:pH-response transcription factor pacC/RIM101 n=1 Tax=Coniophora puteana (strain RWD-64-598) TaxID=741705 RepID=A0A5M3N526_CONPW|nr:uncharacterized protein CONPUDRAFT_160988 [Coniophora puteana RWD-64-598 SS2]EIW86164.1 hypothetical protein CONPUDRAFT_160988 [Coniophora puteana RWD-64-598 SS2]